ncbi:MAG: MarR family winged helix-turn-helix transcriptional regulator [Kineosporiaceae bacterium]
MTTQTVDRELKQRMMRAYYGLRTRMHDAEPTSGRAAALPRTWRHSLLLIDDRPGVTPSALAALLGVTPAAVSPATRELSDRGLIERTTDPRDGRSVQLTIAPAGAEVVAELRRHLEAVVDDLFEPLAADERGQLVDLLERSLRVDTA